MKKILVVALVLVISKFSAQEFFKVGDQVPEIKVNTIKEEPFLLSSLKGKVVLLDFWASWCAPCIEQQPELKNLYQKLDNQVKNGKFEIVGFSLDKSKENWQKIVSRYEIPWVQIGDLKFWKSPVAKNFGVSELPYNILIDENGNVLATNIHGEELDNFLHQYFNK